MGEDIISHVRPLFRHIEQEDKRVATHIPCNAYGESLRCDLVSILGRAQFSHSKRAFALHAEVRQSFR